MKKISSNLSRIFNSRFFDPKYAVFDVAFIILFAINVKFH